MAKRGRTWFALDVSFTHDAKIRAAGESAAWLYLSMLCEVYLAHTHGVLTRDDVVALHVPRWETRVTRLMKAGLVEKVPANPDLYVILAWQDWQSDSARASYMRSYRARRRLDGPPNLRSIDADQEDEDHE